MIAEALAQPLSLDHQFAEPRPWRNDDLRSVRRAGRARGQKLLVCRDARLGLGLTGARARLDPFALARQRLDTRRLALRFLFEPLLLLLQPSRVVALVGHAAPAVEFQDPADRKSTRLNSSH